MSLYRLHPASLTTLFADLEPLRETLGEKHPRAWDELHS